MRSLDPIWTTAYITRNHGYMVYDTLFAVNEQFKSQPQMVDKWTLSDDKLIYTFTLRDGLKWHDGQPVKIGRLHCFRRALDEARRAGSEDGRIGGLMKAVDDKTFSLKLKKPFPLTAGCHRETLEATCLSSCQSASPRPTRYADHRSHGIRAVQVGEGGMGARQQGRLRQEHGLRAAQGTAELGVGRQGSQGRPRRVALHPGLARQRPRRSMPARSIGGR